jgi:hypothetical protein
LMLYGKVAMLRPLCLRKFRQLKQSIQSPCKYRNP